ncbi:MAG: alpha/beta hydrolase, partial [Candidatus Puniceispirillaceae bacterium]
MSNFIATPLSGKKMARDLGSSVFIDQSRALLERIVQCDTLRAISVPCLILCGADDKLCPV